jgi:hypothetical protein
VSDRPYVDEVDDAEDVSPPAPGSGWAVEGEDPEPTVSVDFDGSLASRVAARAAELEQQQTEVFPVPGWADILGAEFRLIGWKEARKISKQSERIRDDATRELYVMLDLMIAGTVALHEFDEKTGNPVATNHTWTSLARAVLPGIGKAVPDPLTTRRALIALIGEPMIPPLYAMWQNWSGGSRGTVDKGVVEDFG